LLVVDDPAAISELTFALHASAESPLIQPAFVVEGWGQRDVEVTFGGKKLQPDDEYRFGHRTTLSTMDLVVWIARDAAEKIRITLAPHSSD
jgi:hypothetical protein